MNAIYATFLTLLWTTTPLAIKWSVDGLTPTLAVTLRFALAATVVGTWLRWHRISSTHGAGLRRNQLIAGGASACSMLCTYWAAQHVSSGLIAVVFGLIPLMTALFARIWLDEVLSSGELLAIACGMGGLVLIFAEHLHPGPGGWQAILIILLAVALQSGAAVWLKRSSTGLPAAAINAGALVVCSFITLLAWLGTGAQLPATAPPATTLGAVLYLALIGSALGFSVYYRLIQSCRPLSVALISLITPASALWLGHIVNKETITPRLVQGSALIMGGILLHLLAQQARRSLDQG